MLKTQKTHRFMGFFCYACLAILASTACHAAQKCVKLTSSSICTDDYNYWDNGNNLTAQGGQSDWGTTCGGVPVHGVSLCGSVGGTVGRSVDSVTVSGGIADNKYCYCKMVQPVVSRWVYAKQHSGGDGGAGDCHYWCANVCASMIITNLYNENENVTYQNGGYNQTFHKSLFGEFYE